MSEVDTYIKESAEVHQFAAEVARIISGIPQMPEFSSESMSVSDTSQLIDSCNSNPGRDCVWMAADWRGCAE